MDDKSIRGFVGLFRLVSSLALLWLVIVAAQEIPKIRQAITSLEPHVTYNIGPQTIDEGYALTRKER